MKKAMCILREVITPYQRAFHTSPLAYDIAIDTQILPEGEYEADSYIMRPHEFCLFRSYEYVKMPETHYGLLFLRRRYAQRKLLFAGGVVHPKWEGHLLIELYNAGEQPLRIKRGERPVTLLLIPLV